ncbi:MAG: ethyl tert-butyl ether degradation EthD [Caulobacter sp.]|nr:ethyl tert-butyl ether degradation EthD [Caulobacter sp.]
MKTIILVNSLEGRTRDQFREHYEAVHAPLGARWFPFYKYLRNHVVEAEPGATEFDGMGEFWAILTPAETAPILAGEAGPLFEDDRALFMSTRRSGGMVEEILLVGPPRGMDPQRTRNELAFVRKKPGVDEATFNAALRAFASELHSQKKARRVVFNRPVEGLGNIQGDGLLQAWPRNGQSVLRGAANDAFELFNWVATESYETLPEELTAAPPYL